MSDDEVVELFEERAAIMQFDGGLSREAAERAAYWDLRNRVIGFDRPVPESIRKLAGKWLDFSFEGM